MQQQEQKQQEQRQQQQQEQQQERTTTTTTATTRATTISISSRCPLAATSFFAVLLLTVSLFDVSHGWSISSSSRSSVINSSASTIARRSRCSSITITRTIPRSTASETSLSLSSLSTAKYYRNPTILTDEFADAAPTSSPPSITIKKGLFPTATKHRRTTTPPPIDCSLPWIDNNENKDDDDAYFLSHWNWQVSYFQKHLTNFRVAKTTTTTEHDDRDGEFDHLMNVHNVEKNQRVYTVSYTSDEFRNIRMTYVRFPGAQIFRCLCYPHSKKIPVLGMGMMKFGNVKNMAVLDYQPLPTTPSSIRNKFESELTRIRSEYPTMNTPMSHRHFDSQEERKYFTDIPLLTRYADIDHETIDVEQHRTELIDAHKEYVKSHIRLTQQEISSSTTANNNDDDDDDVIAIHSDFDTYLSIWEPAGKVLIGALGKEIGHPLVHRVIFPLSRNFQNI